MENRRWDNIKVVLFRLRSNGELAYTIDAGNFVTCPPLATRVNGEFTAVYKVMCLEIKRKQQNRRK